jgi:NitT/TauT family transport system substrate-binding protein
MRRLVAIVLMLIAAIALAGCRAEQQSAVGGRAERVTLRLGYFPNITHATAIVGLESGIFARALGESVTLETATFNAGPAAIEALFSEALDVTYIGPNPAINGYVRSKGEAIRIIAGATSGGAFLVVRPEITSAVGLRGKRVATPQLGNTQDVALRAWLRAHGLRTDPQGGGDVSVLPQENAQSLEAFHSGEIAGAWVPEPWATRLVQEGGGKVLVDERDLWPGGQYVTTHLIVRTAFLERHPEVVERLLRGHVETTAYVNSNTAEAQRLVNQSIERITGRGIAQPVITAAWSTLTFTNDPVASSLRKSAEDAAAFGFLNLSSITLDRIYDLRPLNKVLRETGNREVVTQ